MSVPVMPARVVDDAPREHEQRRDNEQQEASSFHRSSFSVYSLIVTGQVVSFKREREGDHLFVPLNNLN
jgi:hypothetical protein